MPKYKIGDESIRGMLHDEYDRCRELVAQFYQTINTYPRGHIVVKKIKVKGRLYEYHHLQWREGHKVLSRHIPEKELSELMKKIEQREMYRNNCVMLEKRLDFLAPIIGEKKMSRRNHRLAATSIIEVVQEDNDKK